MSNSELSLTTAQQLARAELIDMVPYQSARRLFSSAGASDEKIWLNANEAPGHGEYQLSAENVNRYPDFQPNRINNAPVCPQPTRICCRWYCHLLV